MRIGRRSRLSAGTPGLSHPLPGDRPEVAGAIRAAAAEKRVSGRIVVGRGLMLT